MLLVCGLTVLLADRGEVFADTPPPGKFYADVLALYDKLRISEPEPASLPAPISLTSKRQSASQVLPPPLVVASYSASESQAVPLELTVSAGKQQPLQSLEHVSYPAPIRLLPSAKWQAMADHAAAFHGEVPLSIKVLTPSERMRYDTVVLSFALCAAPSEIHPRYIRNNIPVRLPDGKPPITLDVQLPAINPAVIDRIMAKNILADIQSGALNPRNPGLRPMLMELIASEPFTANAYRLFNIMLEGAAGNTLRKKIATLHNWVLAHESPQLASLGYYYIVYHLYRVRDYDAALEYSDNMPEKITGHQDRLCMLQALCEIQQFKHDRALDSLRKVCLNWPQSPLAPEAIFLAAWIYYQDRNFDEVRALLNELIRRYPESPSVVKARAMLEQMTKT